MTLAPALVVAIERLRALAEYTRGLETQLDGEDAGEGLPLVDANSFIVDYEDALPEQPVRARRTSRVMMETVYIEVGLDRYRAKRDAFTRATDDGSVQEVIVDGERWSLVHDVGGGSSHTVGYSEAYSTETEAVAAASTHECDERP